MHRGVKGNRQHPTADRQQQGVLHFGRYLEEVVAAFPIYSALR